MSSPDPAIQRALDVLNDALERDPEAITKLVNARVDANARLAAHDTVQVGVYGDAYKVGILGLLNGVFGYKRGGIGAVGDVDPRTGRFKRIRRFAHVKSGLDTEA